MPTRATAFAAHALLLLLTRYDGCWGFMQVGLLQQRHHTIGHGSCAYVTNQVDEGKGHSLFRARSRPIRTFVHFSVDSSKQGQDNAATDPSQTISDDNDVHRHHHQPPFHNLPHVHHHHYSQNGTEVFEEVDFTPLAFGSTPDALPLPHHDLHELLLPVDGEGIATASVAEKFDPFHVVHQRDNMIIIDEREEAKIQDYLDHLELPLWQLALAGSIATFISDVTMHPIDCIKTLQQSDSGIGLDVVQASLQLWEMGGIFAFYQGFFTYACADAVGGALKFATWEVWMTNKPITAWFRDRARLPWLQLWIGAALAFVASSVLIVPGELIKQQLQMGHYDGLLDTIAGIHASTPDGISGFFLGYEGVLYRDIPYTMLELGLYEVFKNLMTQSTQEESTIVPIETHGMTDGNNGSDSVTSNPTTSSSLGVWKEVAAAAVTGGIVAFCTTPLDVVKTKMMVDASYENMRFIECALLSIDNNGWTSVFAGVFARISWIFPYTAMYLPTYDALKRFLWTRYEKKMLEEQQRRRI